KSDRTHSKVFPVRSLSSLRWRARCTAINARVSIRHEGSHRRCIRGDQPRKYRSSDLTLTSYAAKLAEMAVRMFFPVGTDVATGLGTYAIGVSTFGCTRVPR